MYFSTYKRAFKYLKAKIKENIYIKIIDRETPANTPRWDLHCRSKKK